MSWRTTHRLVITWETTRNPIPTAHLNFEILCAIALKNVQLVIYKVKFDNGRLFKIEK